MTCFLTTLHMEAFTIFVIVSVESHSPLKKLQIIKGKQNSVISVHPKFADGYYRLPLNSYVQIGDTCWKYLSQLMYSLSWESCSLFVLMYCQRAWMMADRVCVCIPSKRANRGSSLNCGGCNRKRRRERWQWRKK